MCCKYTSACARARSMSRALLIRLLTPYTHFAHAHACMHDVATFLAGSQVSVLSTADDQWWKVSASPESTDEEEDPEELERLKRRVGFVPANFVKLLAVLEPQLEPQLQPEPEPEPIELEDDPVELEGD